MCGRVCYRLHLHFDYQSILQMGHSEVMTFYFDDKSYFLGLCFALFGFTFYCFSGFRCRLTNGFCAPNPMLVKKTIKNKTKLITTIVFFHYDDVIMGMIASQITSIKIVYSTVYSNADQRKHQSSTSLSFVWGIHRGPVNSPHKWPVTRKMFPFGDVIMFWCKKYWGHNSGPFPDLIAKYMQQLLK